MMEMETEPITSFTGMYRWLSNFWLLKEGIKGLVHTYPSVEHAYQAAKCADKNERVKFVYGSAGRAKQLGRTVTVRADWDEVKIEIMRAALKQKFAPDTELAQRLMDTGDAHLIEGNSWGDQYWGQCPVGEGQNNLGKLLMEIRAELQKERQTEC